MKYRKLRGPGERDRVRIIASSVLGLAVALALLPTSAEPGLLSRPDNPACTAPERPSVEYSVTAERAFPKLWFKNSVQMKFAPDNPWRWLIVQQEGQIVAFDATDETVSETSVVLDISDRVSYTSRGLSSLAFHPNYPSDGRIFVTYTAESGDATYPVKKVLSSFTSSDGGTTFDAASEQVLLTAVGKGYVHPWGTVDFGPDGYLYIGMGASGQGEGAQDPYVLDGVFVRIDVDSAFPYAIPPDNPYASGGGAPEVFAQGFRNPFRWSFDDDGNLWVGDVGHSTWEEINLVVSDGNYGWPNKEGEICLKGPCNDPNLRDPISGYERTEAGPAAILGGRVYRGNQLSGLQGKYIFGDFVKDSLNAVTLNEDGSAETIFLGAAAAANDIAEDVDGELYMIRSTHIRRLVATGAAQPSSFPDRLSGLGCFDSSDPTLPGSALIPYNLNVPFWSDGVDKTRWFAIPDDTTIGISEAGDFEYPVGSVLFKNFSLDGKLIETRLLALHEDGEWAGYSFEWDDEESDAQLVATEGKSKTVGSQVYDYPSRAQCMQCHTSGAGRVLGPEVMQLNRDIHYPSTGLSGNQLETYDHIGLLEVPLEAPTSDLPALPSISDSTVGIYDRVRAYLHSNCSQCHMPGESGAGEFDFRYAIEDPGIVNIEPGTDDLGIPGALLIAPGDPEKSIIPLRMRALDSNRMPPIGSNVVHSDGVNLIEEWVMTLSGTPTVSIDVPIAGTTLVESEDVLIEVSAEDTDGFVAKVEFLADGTVLGESSTPPFSYVWAGASVGTHTLSAIAYDDSGLSAQSPSVAIEICPDADSDSACDEPPVADSPVITAPSEGSILPGSMATFEWSASGLPVEKWRLSFGSIPGGRDLGRRFFGPDTLSYEMTGLPVDGSAIYLNLAWKVAGSVDSLNYTFVAASDAPPPPPPVGEPAMVTPTAGSNLTGASQQFSWTADGVAIDYWLLEAGSTPGGSDLFSSGELDASVVSRDVGGLPTDGSTIHVRLSWTVGEDTQFADYQYTAVDDTEPPPVSSPGIISPVAGSVLNGDTVTFSWTTNGTAVTRWLLNVGDAPGASNYARTGLSADTLSREITGLPQDGRLIYVRFYWRAGGRTYYEDYSYIAATSGA